MVFDISFYISYASNNDKFRKAFMSSDGEEYIVDVNNILGRGYSGYNGTPCTVTVSWKKRSRMFLRFRSYCQSKKDILSDVKLFSDVDKLSASSSAVRLSSDVAVACIGSYGARSTSGGTFVIINIIPYDSIPKCLDNMPSSEKQSLTKAKRVVQKRLEDLSTDMKDLFKTGNLSDVTLTDGSEEILAHKLILSMRSSVFSKMFQHPMKENKENRITIKDIPIEVLKSLLKFMYTGTAVLNDMKMAHNLYIAADKYNVKNLKNICSDMLKSVDIDSVVDTLLLADLYEDTQLKQTTLNFIANNYSHLRKLSNWNKFMKEHQSLAIEVLSFVIDRK